MREEGRGFPPPPPLPLDGRRRRSPSPQFRRSPPPKRFRRDEDYDRLCASTPAHHPSPWPGQQHPSHLWRFYLPCHMWACGVAFLTLAVVILYCAADTAQNSILSDRCVRISIETAFSLGRLGAVRR